MGGAQALIQFDGPLSRAGLRVGWCALTGRSLGLGSVSLGTQINADQRRSTIFLGDSSVRRGSPLQPESHAFWERPREAARRASRSPAPPKSFCWTGRAEGRVHRGSPPHPQQSFLLERLREVSRCEAPSLARKISGDRRRSALICVPSDTEPRPAERLVRSARSRSHTPPK